MHEIHVLLLSRVEGNDVKEIGAEYGISFGVSAEMGMEDLLPLRLPRLVATSAKETITA